MDYRQAIEEQTAQPGQLEALYGRAGAFVEAMGAQFVTQPGNLLLAAWHYRLAASVSAVSRWTANWAADILLAVINGLLLWLLSGDQWAIKLSGREYPLFHLPLMAWAAVGMSLMWVRRDVDNRFAFLTTEHDT